MHRTTAGAAIDDDADGDADADADADADDGGAAAGSTSSTGRDTVIGSAGFEVAAAAVEAVAAAAPPMGRGCGGSQGAESNGDDDGDLVVQAMAPPLLPLSRPPIPRRLVLSRWLTGVEDDRGRWR